MTEVNSKKWTAYKAKMVKAIYAKKLVPKNVIEASWKMILYVAAMAIVVIYSSHSVDQKVMVISKLNERIKDLRSQHIDMRTQLMTQSKVTRVSEEVKDIGLVESLQAPYKIVIQN